MRDKKKTVESMIQNIQYAQKSISDIGKDKKKKRAAREMNNTMTCA